MKTVQFWTVRFHETSLLIPSLLIILDYFITDWFYNIVFKRQEKIKYWYWWETLIVYVPILKIYVTLCLIGYFKKSILQLKSPRQYPVPVVTSRVITAVPVKNKNLQGFNINRVTTCKIWGDSSDQCRLIMFWKCFAKVGGNLSSINI